MRDVPPALGRWLPTPLLQVSAAVHLAAVALLAAAPGRWRGALALLAANHAVLAAAGALPRSPLLGPNVSRLDGAAAARGEVALTFDDGPHPEVTPRVLDLLDAAGARASFFLIGRRALAHADVVRDIARRGHRVENHTWRHRHDFAFRGPRTLAREVDRAQEALAGLTGRPPDWFRAPAGMRNPCLAGVLAGRGLRLASWSRRAFDTVRRDPVAIGRRLTSGLAGGEVLLLHDGSSARCPGGAAVVLAALPAVLAGLAERELTAVPLPVPEAG